MQAKVLEILQGMKTFLKEGLQNREKYLVRPENFTRDRKLTFERLCLFLLSTSKRTLSLELDEFFIEKSEWPCTKSAFSQARYRIKQAFFQDWSQHLSDLVYTMKGNSLKKWKGFYLKAIDGTTLYLFDDDAVAAEFDGSRHQHPHVVLGRAGFEIDVLNGYCSNAWLGSYKIGEPHFAGLFLNQSNPDDLRIYDRNFISFELIYRHLEADVPFVMRAMTTFNKVVHQFFESNQIQAIVRFPITDSALKALKEQGFEVDRSSTVKVRLLKIELETGEIEILATSLMDKKKYPFKIFKGLYSTRWGAETQIDKLKNKLQLQIFTGHKPAAIYQDFFINVIMLNLHNLLVQACEKQLGVINEGREIPVALNHNVSIGLLKNRIIQLFDSHSAKSILTLLKLLFLSHLEAVRPDRKYPREPDKKRNRSKYYTFKNYRRAF
jgi:hypothetical protein